MKKGFLLLLLISSFFANAQSLKEALYGGKLKNEAGTVIRKGDDLSTKIDTATKATPEVTVKKPTGVVADSTMGSTALQAGAPVNVKQQNTTSGDSAQAETPAEETVATTEAAAAPKSNNEIWKDYINSITSSLKTEVLSSKKIKNGSYYVLVSYAIETDGQVTVTDVFVSPENSFLQQQVKDRLALETPKMAPTLSSNGTPRKVNKKGNFTLVKE